MSFRKLRRPAYTHMADTGADETGNRIGGTNILNTPTR